MQFVVEFIAWLFIDCVLWGVGAGVKKVLGLELSESGVSEEWVGLVAIIVVAVASFLVFA